MSQALDLLAQLKSAIDSGHEGTLRDVSAAITALPFASVDDVRAKHRLALHLFLSENKVIEAMTLFRDIVRAKLPCDETRLSQISLAMGYKMAGLLPQSVFELRKVISAETGATPIKSLAYTYLVATLKEQKGHERELQVAQNEQIDVLAHLIKTQEASEDLSYFKLLWAAALEERGAPDDLRKALEVTQKLSDDPALPHSTSALAREALKRLSPTRRK